MELARRTLAAATLAATCAAGCATVLGLDPGTLLDDAGASDATFPDGSTLPDADSGDVGAAEGSSCPPGQKMCGTCVPADWTHGCAASDCAPCSAFYAETYTCIAGACAVVTCAPNRADCDHVFANGCETDLSTIAHCRACNVACDGGVCNGTGCAETCTAPTPDQCGTSCVDLDADIAHCGKCAVACSAPNAAFTCTSGKCVFQGCNSPWGDCNNNLVDGCETQINTPQNCGACRNDCTANNPPNTTRGCTSGTACDPLQCLPGWQACNGIANGCNCLGAGCCDAGGADSGFDSGMDAACAPPGQICTADPECCYRPEAGPACITAPMLADTVCCIPPGTMPLGGKSNMCCSGAVVDAGGPCK